jgi:hypothetical protein
VRMPEQFVDSMMSHFSFSKVRNCTTEKIAVDTCCAPKLIQN